MSASMTYSPALEPDRRSPLTSAVLVGTFLPSSVGVLGDDIAPLRILSRGVDEDAYIIRIRGSLSGVRPQSPPRERRGCASCVSDGRCASRVPGRVYPRAGRLWNRL